jgi:hypothetical protein
MIPTLKALDSDRCIELDRSSMLMGSNEWRVDIHLPEDDVHEVHCEFKLESGLLRIVDLSNSGVKVNGEVVRATTLSEGDEIQIGSAVFSLQKSSGQIGSRTQSIQEQGDVTFDSAGDPQEADADLDTTNTQATDLHVADLDPIESAAAEEDADFSVLRVDASNDLESEQFADEFQDSEPAAEVALATVTPLDAREQTLLSEPPKSQPLFSQPAESDDESELDDEQTQVVAEQFFVVLAEREEGPVPFNAIQELADHGAVKPLSPMRREIEQAWSTAQVYGVTFSDPDDDSFEVPDDHPTNSLLRGRPQLAAKGKDTASNVVEADSSEASQKDSSDSQTKSQRGFSGTLAWIAVAPWFYLVSAFAPLKSLKPKNAAVLIGVVLIAAYFVSGWLGDRSQTALTGRVTLDGDGLDNVVITFSGLMTGESAVGVSDSDGDFRLVTMHGRLKTGKYHVVVQPPSATDGSMQQPNGQNAETKIPFKYQSLATTDLTLDISEESDYVEIELSQKRRRRMIR